MPSRLTRGLGARAHREDALQRRHADTAWLQDLGEIPPPKDPARRAAALADYRVFLDTYFKHRFPLEWSRDHIATMKTIEETIRAGESCAVAMPRGSGKTTILEPAPFWAIANGYWAFGVIIASSLPRAVEILDSLKNELRTNEKLNEDFPEYTAPIRHLEDEPRRCKGQRYHGQLSGIRWAPHSIRFAAIPDKGIRGGIIYAAGLTAALRGLRLGLPDGTVVRPDGAIIDDPQTDASARSLSQTVNRLKLIQGAIRGMAGPGRRLSIFAAVTVIQVNDLADRLLDPKVTGWRVVRTKSLYAFPANLELWFKYQEVRRESAALGEDGAATAFYQVNQVAMDAGADVAWPERKSEGKLSALQELMEYWLDDPEAFAAEHQQEPLSLDRTASRIDPAVVSRKVNGRPQGEVPPTCPFVTAYIDTHDKALYWAVVAFEQNLTPYVVDYGAWPEQPTRSFSLASIQRTLRRRYPNRTPEAAILAGADELVTRLLCRRFPKGQFSAGIDKVLADTGYKPEIWQQVKTLHPELGLTKGVGIKAGSKPMLEWERRPGEVIGSHWLTPPSKHREHPVTQIDTNHWKTVAIDAVAAAPGEPGALSFYGDPRTTHSLYAGHLDSETFVQTEGYGRKVVEWKIKPNQPDNHWLDCTVGCFVAASMLGAHQEGAPITPQRGRTRRTWTQADLMQRRRLNAPQ